jgi:glycosyltransferase involved in cell wall biosynthesis
MTLDAKAPPFRPISVVITTKNAAGDLPACLATVDWAAEIVVVDRFSTDETPAICAAHPRCVFVQREGYIQENANVGFERATCDWVMRLDSDERITPELTAEIPGLIASAGDDVVGFAFWERPVILGRELRHGFGRRHHRRMLFRRGRASYPGHTEHDQLEASGVWIQSTHGYIHHNYSAVRQYLEKLNYYTDSDVARIKLPEKPPPVRRAVLETARAFYLYYLKWQGYRDGWVGFVDASMRAVYQLVFWAKVRERCAAEGLRRRDG